MFPELFRHYNLLYLILVLTIETYIVLTHKIAENELTELLLNKSTAILPNQKLYMRELMAWELVLLDMMIL